MLVEYIIANVAIGGIATALYFGIKKLKKPVLCKHCKFLICAGGGAWKYECTLGETRTYILHGFDKPPEYCRHYKSWEDVEADSCS